MDNLRPATVTIENGIITAIHSEKLEDAEDARRSCFDARRY